MRRFTYWSLVTGVVVLLLLPILAGPVPWPPDPVGVAAWLSVAIVIGTLLPLLGDLISRTGQRRARSARQRILLVSSGGAAALVLAGIWLRAGDDLMWAFAPALVASLAIAQLPRAIRRIAIAGTLLMAVVAGLVIDAVPGLETEGPLALTGTAVTGFALVLILTTSWTWEVAVQLDDARQQAAALAVANERLRFAADLHDIQGHHLQVIALKSELAGRLVYADPDTAQREIAQVRQLAADALSDTRAVVQGYRRASLRTELGNLASVLSSAGIEAQLDIDPKLQLDHLTEDARHLLGLVVREAVTNVLRHSTATRAEVTLTHDRAVELTISNDGVSDEPATDVGGLTHLADRLRAAGGDLTWGPKGGCFRVHATLPTDRTAPTVSGPRERRT
ncbi:MAG: sensor histidine kinase [Nitriliruptoraceae bacterium]